MMFSLLTLLLLTLAAAKQESEDCPICLDVIHLSYNVDHWDLGEFHTTNLGDFQDTCSPAINSSNNSPCPDGKVCRQTLTTFSFRQENNDFEFHTKEIDCIHPSTSCWSSSSWRIHMYGESHMECTDSDLFNPDKCPQACMMTHTRISGVDYTEDNCNDDSSQWNSCNSGVNCNFLELTGTLTHTSDRSDPDTVTDYYFGCGLDYSDCRAAENALNTTPGLTISRCKVGEFSISKNSQRILRWSPFIWT